MKSFLKNSALAVITAFAMVSCAKDELKPVETEKSLHFIINTAENSQLKSFVENNLEGGTYTPKWTNGDKLAIFIGDITTSTTAPTATLSNIKETGTIAKFDGKVPTDLTDGTFLSFSPAAAFENGYTDGTVGINLSEIQKPSSLTIDEACDVLVAKPCDFTAEEGTVAINDLYFKRIFSIVKVNLTGVAALNGEKVTSFTFSAPNSILTGRAAVNLSTASISQWNTNNEAVVAKYTTDTPVFGGENGLENTVWLVVNPTTIASGSKVIFSGETENYIFSKEVTLTKDLTFPQSQIAVINLTIEEGNTAKKVYSWDLSVESTSEATADKISWSNSAAEMVCVKGESTTAANNYYPGAGKNSTRFYTNSTLTITPKNGKQLKYYKFEATTEGYASALSKSEWTNAQAIVDGTTVYVIADDPSSAVSCVIYDTCGFTKVECHTDALVLTPSISVTAASIEVPATGDTYTIEYTVKNPVDGKSISAKSNQTWLNNFGYSTSGQVSFVVDENAGEERNASITLSYEGADDVIVSVTQAAAGSASKKTVTYTVTSTSAVSASGDIPSGSSATYSSTYSTKCQLTGGNSMTLTLSGYKGMIVKGLTLSMKSNSDKGAGYLSVKSGDTSLGSIGSPSSGVKFNTTSWHGAWSTSYVDVTPALSNNAYIVQDGEDIVIVIGATANSLYCQSFTIEYAQVGSTGGGSEPEKLADPEVSCTAKTENSLTFSWAAVDHASGYKVSTDGGNTYEDTQKETSYTWTGLTVNTTKTLYVKAIGDGTSYTDSDAASAKGTTTAGSGSGEGGTTKYYEKVTSDADIVDGGKYLIVYNGKAANGCTTGVYLTVTGITVENDRIKSNTTIDSYAFTINSVEGGYTLKIGDNYIGYYTSTKFSTSTTVPTSNKYFWTFTVQANNSVLIKNVNKDDRFIGADSSTNVTQFRAYSTNNVGTYPQPTLYKLAE